MPAKVLISYLVVVSAGAMPTYFYIRHLFLHELTQDAVQSVATRTLLMADTISRRKDVAARVAELEHLSPLFVERVTYISGNGRVLFDSVTADNYNLGNHLNHLEVARAIGVEPPDPVLTTDIPHMGVSRRTSEITHTEALFVAVKVVNAAGNGDDFLRLSMPVANLQALLLTVARVFRNSEAAAVSMSILLSLLAAVVFVRPLQRLSRAARALAGGDYTVDLGDLGHDEVGDVGRSLQKLAEQLRQRLAVAEAGEAMVVQLVGCMQWPMAIIAPDGRLVVVNGAARDTFAKTLARGEAALMNFSRSEGFLQARDAAETLGEPIHLTHKTDDQNYVTGWVHILRHPTMAPFVAFMGEEAVRRPCVRLPKEQDLKPASLSDLFSRALARSQGCMEQVGLTLVVEGAIPDAKMCEAFGRLELALTVTMCGLMAPTGSVHVSFVEKPTRIAVVWAAALDDSSVEALRTVLAPLGGQVKSTHKRCILLLSRA